VSELAVVLRPRPLSFLPARLFQPEQILSYVVTAWLLALLGSIILAPLASWLVGGPSPEFPALGTWQTIFSLVVYAPVVETIIMGGVLLILDKLVGFTPAILISSAGWGIAHSLVAPAWGLVIWWPFLIFSITFLIWRRRSLLLAFGMPMVVHGLQNLGPALLLVSGVEG
jgi:hypothetical protein